MVLIADGVMGLITPRWQSLLWRFGPELMKAANEELAAHRKTARTIYFAELVGGIALASLQTPEV
ncbi:MAG TPA: hypothetical protein VG095_03955 [Chthoniobacterales bacterium]|nr:hypothetical protein [Chthoniobacterales bacterium]